MLLSKAKLKHRISVSMNSIIKAIKFETNSVSEVIKFDRTLATKKLSILPLDHLNRQSDQHRISPNIIIT